MCSSKYNLNNFCNVIAKLRKERMWTQSVLAEKIGVSPQSVSKWECGIGYPDVTLFPVIAEAFVVPIGVLFGECSDSAEEQENEKNELRFRRCSNIKVLIGNVCRIEFIEETETNGIVKFTGDTVFKQYFSVEENKDTLFVNIKNPSGSATHWNGYDRCGFEDENVVQIFTGFAKDTSNIEVINFLDLKVISRENEKGNYEVRCCKMEAQ